MEDAKLATNCHASLLLGPLLDLQGARVTVAYNIEPLIWGEYTLAFALFTAVLLQLAPTATFEGAPVDRDNATLGFAILGVASFFTGLVRYYLTGQLEFRFYKGDQVDLARPALVHRFPAGEDANSYNYSVQFAKEVLVSRSCRCLEPLDFELEQSARPAETLTPA